MCLEVEGTFGSCSAQDGGDLPSKRFCLGGLGGWTGGTYVFLNLFQNLYKEYVVMMAQ